MGAKYLSFCSSEAYCIITGPHIPRPISNMPPGTSYFASSCPQIILSIGEASIPPYSLGQCSIAQPASYFFFFHALATFRCSANDGSPDLGALLPLPLLSFSSALASNHSLHLARNFACSGVSLKSIIYPFAKVFVFSRFETNFSFQVDSDPTKTERTFERL